MQALARAPEHLLKIVGIVLRLLVVSGVHSVRLSRSQLGVSDGAVPESEVFNIGEHTHG